MKNLRRNLTYVKRVQKPKVSIFPMDFNDFFMFDASVFDAKIDRKSMKFRCQVEVGLGTSFLHDFFDFLLFFERISPPKTAPKSTSNLLKIVQNRKPVLDASWERLGRVLASKRLQHKSADRPPERGPPPLPPQTPPWGMLKHITKSKHNVPRCKGASRHPPGSYPARSRSPPLRTSPPFKKTLRFPYTTSIA